ncbi:MAG: hypothetical protein ACP5K1_05255, partial [Candidatus Bathyarchaeia archaeon]
LGTVNPSGGEIWRSKDGVEWERMVDNGFGDVENVHVIPELTFRDQLYVVTANYLDGLNVFRSTDGKVWERVVENAFGYGGKNPFEVLTEINGTLYLCVAGTWPLGVFQIWKSDDGKNWIQVGQTGFGNENNFFGGIGLGSDGFLYVSTLNPVDGLEAWRSKDGLKWEMIFKEERSSKTHKGGGLIEFNNHLYMHIYDTEGLEIWKYMTPLMTVTSAQTSTTSVFSTPIQTLTTAKLTTAKSGWGIKEYAIITVAAAVPALALFITSNLRSSLNLKEWPPTASTVEL